MEQLRFRVSRNGKELGYYSAEEIVSYLAEGSLFDSDFFWSEGMPDWQPLSKFPKPTSRSHEAPKNQTSGPRIHVGKIAVLVGGILALGIAVSVGVFSLFFGAEEIDGSSVDSYHESLEKVRKGVSEENAKDFDSGLTAIAFDGQNLFSLIGDPESGLEGAMEKLDGMTAEEIIEAGRNLERIRQEKERTQIGEEIAELEERAREAEVAKEGLKRFRVKRSLFYFDEDGFRPEPIIELTVSNETDQAVSRAYFHGRLSTPGRSVPWVEDNFNYEISGGLEPGESATWYLSPNMFGEWSKAPKDRDDMVFTASVIRIDDANGQPIHTDDFSERDLERLESLRQLISGESGEKSEKAP